MLGYWPGSAVHQRATLENPRFEDFEYCSFNSSDDLDILSWMGNGMIEAQVLKTSTTGYLDDVDVPPVPKSCFLSSTPPTPLTPPTPPDYAQNDVRIKPSEARRVAENGI
jgi:hypothetical protein